MREIISSTREISSSTGEVETAAVEAAGMARREGEDERSGASGRQSDIVRCRKGLRIILVRGIVASLRLTRVSDLVVSLRLGLGTT